MKYEIKKLIVRKEIWIVFVLSVIAVVILSFRSPWANFSTLKAAHIKTAEYYSFSLDEAQKKIADELETADNSTNSALLAQMQSSAKSYKMQEENMKSLLAVIYHEKEFTATNFERRDLEHAIKQYNRKINYRLCDSKQLNLAFLHLNDFEAIHYLFLLIVCTLFAPLFTIESESGMYQLVFISKSGKSRLFLTKIFGSIFCSAFFSLFYTVIMFVIFWLKFGLSFQLLFIPVQCAACYQNCPFTISILTFLLLTVAMRTLVGILLIALTAVVSSVFKRTAIVFASTVGISGLFILFSKASVNSLSTELFMKRIGLILLPVLGNYLTEYETVNVFGYPVEQFWLSISVTCSIILVLLSGAYIFYSQIT